MPESQEQLALTREFVTHVITARQFAADVATLAVTLAQQAGEPVQRPLSREQIERAVRISGDETRMVMDVLIARLETLRTQGKLPEEASVPVW